MLLLVVSVQAQKNMFWKKVNTFLTTIKNIDTVYVYHPKLSFTLGAFTTLQQVGFDVKVKFMVNDFDATLSGISTYGIDNKLSPKLGLEVGYGKFGLGFGFDVIPQNKYKKRTFAFSVLGVSWGMHINYYNIKSEFRSGIILGIDGDDSVLHDEIIIDKPASLNSFAFDAYYAFNNKRFAYPACYKVGLVQRRTVGSWMVTGCFDYGRLYNSPEVSCDSYNLLDCFSTIQISLGGGYSGNIVCWHKDPHGPRDKGLRNITINLTALPVITFFDYLRTTSYVYDENGNHSGKKESNVFCYPMPNVIGSGALGITLDRCFISTQFVYNWFFFLSTSAYDRSKLKIPDYVDKVRFNGSFYDWTLKILFTYKF